MLPSSDRDFNARLRPRGNGNVCCFHLCDDDLHPNGCNSRTPVYQGAIMVIRLQEVGPGATGATQTVISKHGMRVRCPTNREGFGRDSVCPAAGIFLVE